MFLFITTVFLFTTDPGICLNTSHVLIYRKENDPTVACVVRLNTSHVLIYLKEEKRAAFDTIVFKYISCSYLSDWRNLQPFL